MLDLKDVYTCIKVCNKDDVLECKKEYEKFKELLDEEFDEFGITHCTHLSWSSKNIIVLYFTNNLFKFDFEIRITYVDNKEKINEKYDFKNIKLKEILNEINTKLFLGSYNTVVKTIKSIQYNEEKGVTVVVFTDGTSKIAKKTKDDEFDPEIGVAICLASYLFGTKTKFKEFVSKNLKIIEKN